MFVLLFSDEERNNYQLLCLDGSRAAVSEFKNCHLAYVAAHAVVARNGDANDQEMRAAILALLDKAEVCEACMMKITTDCGTTTIFLYKL